MASQAPEARSLQSWEQAFQYPLPVVRKLELQLRKNVDENRTKLRSLVGASYRDLLGTAERIIGMEGQIRQVETHLSDIGRKCNARAVERAVENDKALRRIRGDGEEAKLRSMAQTKVMQTALAVVGRIIKAGGDALLAAKLLVLARLLQKNVAESPDPPALIEELRRRLSVLRKGLLAYIERSLVKTRVDKAALGNKLCAFALVTSSTPKDVLRRFLQARHEQLEAKCETPSEAALLETLELHSQTLLETKDIFPRRFSEALAQLAQVPLLRDDQVRSVSELSLEVYEQWIADDIRTFTPWVRHDQLTVSEAADGMASWSTQARTCLLEGLKEYLEAQTTAQSVLTARRKVLTSYLALGGKVRDASHSHWIDEVREAFLGRLKEILAQSAGSLSSAFDEIDQLGDATPKTHHPGLWSLASQDFDLANGATGFRDSILQSRHGRSASVNTVCQGLDSWMTAVHECWSVIDHMRAMKWDDDLDLDLDDISDLAEGDSLQTVLSRRDPDTLQTELRAATGEAFRHAYHRLEAASESPKQRAVTLLRMLGELDHRRRDLGERAGCTEPLKSHSTLASNLHNMLADSVCEAPMQLIMQCSGKKTRATSTALWDGLPPLPIQPSPSTFKYMMALQKSMADIGEDLWSPDAVRKLKVHLDIKLAAYLDREKVDSEEVKEPLTNTHTNDHHLEGANGERIPTPARGEVLETSMDSKAHVQQLFDTLYLGRCLGPSVQGSKMDKLAASMVEQVELDKASWERLQKNANEYWKRTYLLFGLLAPPHD